MYTFVTLHPYILQYGTCSFFKNTFVILKICNTETTAHVYNFPDVLRMSLMVIFYVFIRDDTLLYILISLVFQNILVVILKMRLTRTVKFSSSSVFYMK